ncbi:antitoxin VapB family protein [Candidatus Micrarchaeota archaeon]|nr:antitoxin VapB family protein [Candidatus Micrarchaeota archaeon]
MKTITITQDAFDAVKSNKGEGESYSELLLKAFKRKKTDLRELVGFLGENEEEAREMQKRLKEIREEDTRGFEEREKFHEHLRHQHLNRNIERDAGGKKNSG